MTRHRLRSDLSHLVSWLLLGSAAATIATGIIADAWDLNGFRTHTIAGYVMTVAALAHVVLSWGRLVSYARYRLRGVARGVRSGRAAGRPGGGSTPPAPAKAQRSRPAPATPLARRRLLGVAVTGAAGFLAGRGLRPPPVIPHGSDVGVVYHEWSKPGVTDALGTLTDWGGKPPLYKTYPAARSLPLPDQAPTTTMPVPVAIQRRRSTREYAGTPLPLEQLAILARHAGGLRDDSASRRTAPSSGALYPIEIYPVVNAVDGLDRGVYHYDIRRHRLNTVRSGDQRGTIMHVGLDQDFLAVANVVFVLTLVHQRMRFKYRDRSYRYGLLEAGHLGQNLYLSATAMGLGACAVGAFRDDGLNELLGVDGREEVAVYLVAAGSHAA